HWRLGCTEELTAQFRHHTLGYLASSKSSPAELADYRKWIPYLELYDGGGRERQDLTLVMGRKLELWGYEWETSPAELYYALDYLLFPPHEPLEPGLNPESEALQAVLAIRGLQLRGEELPSHYPLSPELGQYQLNYFGGARIVLREVDSICRPGAVVEFEALEPQEKR
ncbi:MAG: hypothetical protein KC800_33740, partial [Candidatus Eremiobacteraeota bacterium]|nr:hypothetical protein [Candidatus Eremiobacteraeota bacterium]